MMKQESFEKRYQAQWRPFEHWLECQSQRERREKTRSIETPHLYRQICRHLALAGQRQYSSHLALFNAGRHSRCRALREAARTSLTLLYGATAVLLAAAFIEVFRSFSTVIEPSIKYWTGTGLWLALIPYFSLGGRCWYAA